MDQKELREQENRCIQDQAPACTATCPVHVDARAMAAAIAGGDFEAANKIYRKSIPFPEIISRVCTQPCKQPCLRKDLGGSIEIAALERAAMKFGLPEPEPIRLMPRKTKTVAIVGGGICGLTAAYYLARKGWGVVIFEATDRLGGTLWQTPPVLLPRDILISDLEILSPLEIDIRLENKLDDASVSRLTSEYDAVLLSFGPQAVNIPNLTLTEGGQVAVDPLTFQTSLEKVFAAGDILRPFTEKVEIEQEVPRSAILSLSEGRRAAITIDRFLQKVSLTASRVNEGPYQTKLYTNLSEVQPLPNLIDTDLTTNYEREMAEAEAARCIQCECLECVKNCEYLRHYKGYPKKYIREVYNNLAIVMGTRHSNQFINSCALCGQCAEICPTDVDFGAVCHEARVTMVEQKRMPPSAHDFALQDMAFSNGEKFSLARNAPAVATSEYVFFPGCQLSGSSPEHVEKAYSFLREKLPNVGLMLGCCGAPADWAGNNEIFRKSQAEFLSKYEKLGKPKVVLACSSCYQVFQKHYPEVEIVSLWVLYEKFGLDQLSVNSFPTKVTVHDPCATRYENQIQDSVRNILHTLGYEIEELVNSRERTECCSYGGMMWLANRPVAEKMIEKRIHESPLDYVTYCAMCRDFFSRRGKRTLHLLDLLYGPTSPVGFSQRHENRARLKEKLLRELWSETMPEGDDFEKIRLILPSDVRQMVEDRLILVEDMQKVLENAERTGKRMFNAKTGHYLASFKPTTVTYWVEYTPQPDGSYLVHKGYSHRMELGIGAKNE